MHAIFKKNSKSVFSKFSDFRNIFININYWRFYTHQICTGDALDTKPGEQALSTEIHIDKRYIFEFDFIFQINSIFKVTLKYVQNSKFS